MKRSVMSSLKLLGIGFTLALFTSSCDTDDATQIDYGVYASPDLLAIAKPEVKVDNSDGKKSSWILDIRNFGIAPNLNITVGNLGMLYWSTGEHFDRFGVESTLTVTYKINENADLTSFNGQVVFAHGIVGSVNTKNKDGDFYEMPVSKPETAKVFTLPEDAVLVKAYLEDLATHPDVVTVKVDGTGEPSVNFK